MNFAKRATCLAASVALVAMLAGCATKVETVTPEMQATMMSDLQAGKLNLDCGLKCDLTWITQESQVHALDIAERWQDLAVRVMQIGYGNDLAYYYLGQSAQGLGYHQAAIAYYNYAYALSNGTNPLLKCEGSGDGGGGCQGVDLIASIPVLIQASRDAIAKQEADAAAAAAAAAPAPVHHHHKPKPKWVAPPPPSDAAPASGSGGSGWVAPPPPPPATPPAQ